MGTARQEQLEIHRRNLVDLERRRAQSGLDVSLKVARSIEHERGEIERLEQEMLRAGKVNEVVISKLDLVVLRQREHGEMLKQLGELLNEMSSTQQEIDSRQATIDELRQSMLELQDANAAAVLEVIRALTRDGRERDAR